MTNRKHNKDNRHNDTELTPSQTVFWTVVMTGGTLVTLGLVELIIVLLQG